MKFENITLEGKGTIARLTINRPTVLNALNRQTILELKAAGKEISENNEWRGLIITGAGEKSFVAGADISEFSSLTPAEARDLASLGQQVTRGMERLRIPVVAAVNGYCLGGGFEMALACDFMFASDNAVLGLPEVGLGLIPGWGGTQRLARLIGPNRARQLLLSGERLRAEEAKNWGIVNAVFSQADLLPKAEELLQKIAANSPFAVAQAKRACNEGLETDLDHALLFEQTLFGLCFSTDDCREGAKAFKEKRKPQFTGK